MTQQHRHDHDDPDGHGHGHGGDDVDWEAMADSLELDAAITMPIVDQILDCAAITAATRVLDVGCGPGVVAVHIAERSSTVSVTAVDTSEALLARVKRRAADACVGERVDTVAADLERALPPIPPVDLVWASMVLHHVADPAASLQHLFDRLRPGGTLVVLEFGRPPTVLPSDDPLMLDGTWQRFQAATAASLNERLGLDPTTIDWQTLLRRAGFVVVTDDAMVAQHTAPLAVAAQSWLVQHLRRGVEMAGGRMSQKALDEITAIADSVPKRRELAVRAERRVLIARRP
jgi:SAM-dependent methyltransferase